MGVHIGSEIEKIYQQSGMKLSEFAKRINTSSRNIYSIFSRSEIKTDQLQKISEVLKFNFFSLYGAEPPRKGKVAEPAANYQKPVNRVVVTIELDGKSTTLEQHIKRITAINKLISKG